ncbi:MAG: hypothetical protein HKO82_09355 [Acidimicrobiia bacterium]|nr:hypothetical protein [Acidimicrobiia bacterium]
MRRAALIALLALAASACTIDVNIGISLNRTDTGTVSVEVAADEEFHDLFALTGREFEDLIASRAAEVGLAFEVESGPITRYSTETRVVSYDTVEGILEGLAPGIGSVTITGTERDLEIDGQLNPLTRLDDLFPYFENEDPAQFADDVSVAVTVAMPGEVAASTATSRQDGQLTWIIPFSDSDTRLLARSVLEKESPRIPWTSLIVGGTILAAVVFLVAIRSRLTETETVSPMRATGPSSRPTTPEDQAVAPTSTPPEDQPVAPTEDPGGS